MVARIHFDLERTVAKFRLAEKLRGNVPLPSGDTTAEPTAGESAPPHRSRLALSEARTSFDDIERRLTKRLLS